MAHHRVIHGRSTAERLDAELTRLQETGERITVAEFARRAKVSYATLTHQHRAVAEEVRRLRDQGQPRQGALVTRPRQRHEDLGEATELIRQLRAQVSSLTKELGATKADLERSRRRVDQLHHVEATNERLRGIVVSLSESLLCDADRQRLEELLGTASR
jgi:chromosome segregation ATPase